MSRSLAIARAAAVTMIVALVLFPAVTRLGQIGVPQNPAAFSGVHRSGVMPASPELAVPEGVSCYPHLETVTHPADGVEEVHTAPVTIVRTTLGLRAPPLAL